MDIPRECHSLYSKSKKNKYYIRSFMCGIKENNTNESLFKTETQRHRNQTHEYQKGAFQKRG